MTIDAGNREDFARRARDEHLVRLEQVGVSQRGLADGEARMSTHFENEVPRDSLQQTRFQRWREDLRLLHQKEV